MASPLKYKTQQMKKRAILMMRLQLEQTSRSKLSRSSISETRKPVVESRRRRRCKDDRFMKISQRL